MKFPSRSDAPTGLYAIDGNCGLLAAWGVLTYFGRRTSVRTLVKSCRYTKEHGVFTIALALALRDQGLSVVFHSDPDPHPKPIERICYARARAVGLPLKPAINVRTLVRQTNRRHVSVVFYNTPDDVGHFSPLLGLRSDNLRLPYSRTGSMSVREFSNRWKEAEILRQCIVVADAQQADAERRRG
jgi:hypothetical protein